MLHSKPSGQQSMEMIGNRNTAADEEVMKTTIMKNTNGSNSKKSVIALSKQRPATLTTETINEIEAFPGIVESTKR